MTRYRLQDAALADVVEMLAWTHAQFGEVAWQRYEGLIVAVPRHAVPETTRDWPA